MQDVQWRQMWHYRIAKIIGVPHGQTNVDGLDPFQYENVKVPICSGTGEASGLNWKGSQLQ